MSNIFIWVKKELVWVFLEIGEIRDNDNETYLKEGGGNRNVNYSAPLRDAHFFRLNTYRDQSYRLLQFYQFCLCIF